VSRFGRGGASRPVFGEPFLARQIFCKSEKSLNSNIFKFLTHVCHVTLLSLLKRELLQSPPPYCFFPVFWGKNQIPEMCIYGIILTPPPKKTKLFWPAVGCVKNPVFSQKFSVCCGSKQATPLLPQKIYN
jgi:hypothetical protein